MATLEELQRQVEMLQQTVDALTTPPTDYYTHRWSGEEIDRGIDRAREGGALDVALSNKVTWDSGYLTSGTITGWAESQMINTHVAVDNNVSDLPYPGYWGVEFYLWPSGQWRVLVATDMLTGNRHYCLKNNLNAWTKWNSFSTATSPQEHNIPLVEGISGTAICFKTQENVVIVILSSLIKSQWTSNDAIGTLPEGYRPNKELLFAANVGNGTITVGGCGIQILPNGSISEVGNVASDGVGIFGACIFLSA